MLNEGSRDQDEDCIQHSTFNIQHSSFLSHALAPPSTTTTCPVIPLASSLIRKAMAAATSSGVIMLRMGISRSCACRWARAGNARRGARFGFGARTSTRGFSDTDRAVPNVGKVHLRFFQGWDAKGWDGTQPAVKVPANASLFSPGPTLRANAGDKKAQRENVTVQVPVKPIAYSAPARH